MTAPLLNIKAVSELANLSTHTIRAWERRHKVISPRRDSSGRRVYSMSDVETLRLLSELTNAGHSIKNLTNLSHLALTNLRHESRRPPTNQRLQTHSDPLRPLLSAIMAFELERFEREFLKVRLNTPLSSLVLDILSPLLREIGRMVANGRLEISQEHLLSATLRNHLGEILAIVQKTFSWSDHDSPALPRLIFTTSEGDLHEFGILLAALLAGNQGFKFRYLGPNMPAEDLAKTAATLQGDIIVLGCAPGSEESFKTFIKKLDKQSLLSPNGSAKEIWIGGGSKKDLRSLKTSAFKTVYFPDLVDFQKKLSLVFSKAKKGNP